MIPAIEHAYPRQVILITSRAEINHFGKKTVKDNIMAASWHSPVSFEPPLYSIFVGKTRFTYQLIKKSQVFAVNFMSIDNQKEVLYCGSYTGENINKFEKSGLTKKECEKIDCPYIGEALAYIECSVQEEVEVGDHILFAGKILKSKKIKEGKRIFQDKDDFITTK